MSALLICCANVNAQQLPDNSLPRPKNHFSFGPKVEGNQLQLQVDQVVANKYYIYNSDDQYQGYRLGVFGRVETGGKYVQAELGYLHNTAFVQFVNLNPDEDKREGVMYVWTHTGPVYDFRRIDLTGMAGYKLNRWLHVQAGGIVAYQFYDKSYRVSEEEYDKWPMMENDRIWMDFPLFYNRWLLSGKVGISTELGRFILDANYERSLTNVGSKIKYKEQEYPLRQRNYLFQIGIAYKLIDLK
ncbi:hypothetical protein H9Q13_17225 [Pontibacter sp. JH31]|uniref:Outer membrane protein beta-barrel domain-containing protein n=1 Tax=Pontibacter aquaedesilientis TaxID=2766980 RepID=A0ABR7XKV8_9BACT|nr:hypothetical protein [Pontibacter aquaedesilientis]MBD1398915.1 hypothetical protein [Pontibacter aquaedesilientis]